MREQEHEEEQLEPEQKLENQEYERGLKEGRDGKGEGEGGAPGAVEVHALDGYPIRALVRE